MLQKLSQLPIKWHHLLFYSLLLAIIPHTGFWFDLNNDWPRWSSYAFEHGLSQIYNSDTNYMPFYLHGLYWFGKLQGSKELIYANSYQLKYFFLLFDFGGAIAIAWALRKYYTRQFAEYMLLFNIGYLYCTVIWGQLDSVPTTIAVLAIICLFERKLLWAAFFCTLSVYVKLQTIIFLPFFAILLVYQLVRKFDKWLTIKMLGISLLTQLWLLSPFIWGGTFWNFLKVVRESVGFFPRVSWNAYNIWYLLLKQDPTLLNDTLIFAGLTYKKWGFILFFSLSAVTFIPLIINTLAKLKYKTDLDKKYYTLVWLTAGTIAILFFFVNTQMHERYSYPAIALYFAYALLSNRYTLFALTSFDERGWNE
jgi:Gpi18-like mannosyltransferase